MSKKIALLVGNGRYAVDLHRRLRKESEVAALAIALFPREYSIFSDFGIDEWIDIFKPSDLAMYLHENGVTHVVFGGDFRQDSLAELWTKYSRHSHGDADSVDPMLAEVERRITARASPSYIINLVGSAVRRCNGDGRPAIIPIAASSLLPELRPGIGILAHSGKLANWSVEDIEKYIEPIILKARRELSNQPWPNARQAFLFDDGELAHQNQGGTDLLLGEAAGKPRPNGIRTLIKVCPEDHDHDWDPPVVGCQTLDGALNAYVDLVVIESKNGILFGRDTCIKTCQEIGITLFGV
jgi:hypothetical protein